MTSRTSLLKSVHNNSNCFLLMNLGHPDSRLAKFFTANVIEWNPDQIPEPWLNEGPGSHVAVFLLTPDESWKKGNVNAVLLLYFYVISLPRLEVKSHFQVFNFLEINFYTSKVLKQVINLCCNKSNKLSPWVETKFNIFWQIKSCLSLTQGRVTRRRKVHKLGSFAWRHSWTSHNVVVRVPQYLHKK